MGGMFRNHADRAIVFQNDRTHLRQVGVSLAANCGHEFVTGQLCISQGLLIDLTIMNKNLRTSFDQMLRLLAEKSNLTCEPVHRDECHRENHSSGNRIIPPVHRVLYGIAEHQQQHQIKRAHLADLTLARDSQDHDQKNIDDNAPQDEFPPRESHVPHHTELT